MPILASRKWANLCGVDSSLRDSYYENPSAYLQELRPLLQRRSYVFAKTRASWKRRFTRVPDFLRPAQLFVGKNQYGQLAPLAEEDLASVRVERPIAGL
jgi:hypothetical protein